MMVLILVMLLVIIAIDPLINKFRERNEVPYDHVLIHNNINYIIKCNKIRRIEPEVNFTFEGYQKHCVILSFAFRYSLQC